MPERNIITVSALNKYVKQIIDAEDILNSVWVRGELSNFIHHRSGHMYMTLKDENSLIKTVMFKGSADKLTFEPQSGMKVVVHGRVSVFERDGAYQLYIDDMIPDGFGALNIAYEQLKEELRQAGLFDEAKKKKLPRLPNKIGIVTSPTGAAIRDMINILGRRYPLAEIILYPALVQGEDAPPTIIRGIEYFNSGAEPVDVIIIGRGGGSIEDLWAFNSKELAYAIAASETPVISAVGHETDFTIADFVADLRAPTPSAAAELAVPNAADMLTWFDGCEKRMAAAMGKRVELCRRRLDELKSRRCMESPMYQVDQRRMNLDYAVKAFASAMKLRTEQARKRLSEAAASLNAMSPLNVLARGYSISEKEGRPLRSAKELSAGDAITVLLRDGSAGCRVETVVEKDNISGGEKI
ncbi:MAG: exodeoxyribonuclease VII large subunit [Clostridia bacterium]|nr:exodeoxyribonuclease VII large subunit [Clostridia bacterium]